MVGLMVFMHGGNLVCWAGDLARELLPLISLLPVVYYGAKRWVSSVISHFS